MSSLASYRAKVKKKTQLNSRLVISFSFLYDITVQAGMPHTCIALRTPKPTYSKMELNWIMMNAITGEKSELCRTIKLLLLFFVFQNRKLDRSFLYLLLVSRFCEIFFIVANYICVNKTEKRHLNNVYWNEMTSKIRRKKSATGHW